VVIWAEISCEGGNEFLTSRVADQVTTYGEGLISIECVSY
jgi:hypothetical protein